MRLPEDEAQHFIALYVQTIGRCAGRLEPDGTIHDGASYVRADLEEKVEARDRVFDHPAVIAEYVADNPDELGPDDLARIDAWQSLVRGDLVIERDLKRHTIFLRWQDDPVAYGVLSLLDDVLDLIPAPPPMLVDAVLLPWDGRIVCDGILRYRPVQLGAGIRRSLAAAYRKAKQRGIVTSLEPARRRNLSVAAERAERIGPEHLERLPGLRRAAMDALLQRQPATVTEALAIPGIGRKAAARLLDLGLLRDADGKRPRRAPRSKPRLSIVDDRKATSSTLHLVRVTLRHIKPEIWRRVLVPSDINLGRFHDVLQASMGWHDAHLHDFVIGNEHFGTEYEGAELPWEVRDETRVQLGEVVDQGDVFSYLYDFGDDWLHEIEIERVLDRPEGVAIGRAVCLDGARACPPEDCGGPPGYEHVVAVLADDSDPEHAELSAWCGDWQPARFDIDRVNRRLK